MAAPPSLTPPLAPAPSLPAGAPRTLAAAHKAAEEFEAVFLSTMLSQMFAGVPTDGPFGGGFGEETFRGMLIEQYGTRMAAGGGIGLSDAIARELLTIQEASHDSI